VEILEVTETPETTQYREKVPGKKDSRELARLVVRDDTLEGLKAKLAAHVSLV
jgi:hypothetical protein